MFVWETKMVCVSECVHHGVSQWSKVESQRAWGSDVTERDVGRARGSPMWRGEELAARWGNRWWRKSVRRRTRDVCIRLWTHPVRWTRALAGQVDRNVLLSVDGILPWGSQPAHRHPTLAGYLYCTVGKERPRQCHLGSARFLLPIHTYT